MIMKQPKVTKEQVEAKLNERAASIAERIDALENELPVSPKRFARLASRKTLLKVGGAVAAALLIGAILSRVKNGPLDLFQEGVDLLSADVAREIRKNIRRGMDEDEAVATAIRKRPPVLHLDERSSVFTTVLSQISRQLAASLVPIIVDKISSRLGKSDRKK